MTDVTFSTDFDKGVPNGHDPQRLDHERAKLVTLIKTQSNGHDPAPESNGHDPARESNHSPVSLQRSRHEVDAKFAAEARCSVGQVRAARKLVRSANEDLTVAALLQLLMPISTALRGAVKPRPNARHARWQRLVELCGQ